MILLGFGAITRYEASYESIILALKPLASPCTHTGDTEASLLFYYYYFDIIILLEAVILLLPS